MPASTKVRKAVIPAAGFGTRMLPATKAIPKEMLPVAGKPLIQYAVEEAVASGIETVIFVTRDNKSMIQKYFVRDRELESFLEQRQLSASTELVQRLTELADLQYVRQENPLGLANAVSCARPFLGNEPFVVLLPDVILVHNEPVTLQLIRAYEQHGGSIVAVREIEQREVERFGIVQIKGSRTVPFGKSVRVTGLVEKPSADNTPSWIGIFGRYLLEPFIGDAIEQTEDDARGEVQLTDALNWLCHEKPAYGLFFDGQHYDAGDRLGYLKANIELSLRDPCVEEPLRSYLTGLLASTEQDCCRWL
jgi:UTP--glucose-1-phosphate uridylyltransferase